MRPSQRRRHDGTQCGIWDRTDGEFAGAKPEKNSEIVGMGTNWITITEN